eukprot:scaffold377_cov563-Prasinococcus_capsulatus_cf.AAC.38
MGIDGRQLSRSDTLTYTHIIVQTIAGCTHCTMTGMKAAPVPPNKYAAYLDFLPSRCALLSAFICSTGRTQC